MRERRNLKSLRSEVVVLAVIVLLMLFQSCEKTKTPCNDYANPDCPNYDAKRVRIEQLKNEIETLVLDSIAVTNEGRAVLAQH